ncbi:hypothetical protein WN944_003817 [Citrus x changshan-huyou]|uniref:Uncharacterized protein n=1 Tax=Citrus x changshan-huyou TaxID=2935761 RepID=A0AAP0LZB6_9ROSI
MRDGFAAGVVDPPLGIQGHEQGAQSGLRLPFHPFVRTMLDFYKRAPGQRSSTVGGPQARGSTKQKVSALRNFLGYMINGSSRLERERGYSSSGEAKSSPLLIEPSVRRSSSTCYEAPVFGGSRLLDLERRRSGQGKAQCACKVEVPRGVLGVEALSLGHCSIHSDLLPEGMTNQYHDELILKQVRLQNLLDKESASIRNS